MYVFPIHFEQVRPANGVISYVRWVDGQHKMPGPRVDQIQTTDDTIVKKQQYDVSVSGESKAQEEGVPTRLTACSSNLEFIRYYYNHYNIGTPPAGLDGLKENSPEVPKLLHDLLENLRLRRQGSYIDQGDYIRRVPAGYRYVWRKARHVASNHNWIYYRSRQQFYYNALFYPTNVCAPRQKTAIKISGPFNPTDETNVFKANKAEPGNSLGFGGTIQGTTAGARDYDVMGASIGSASLRYRKFPTKDIDVLSVQAGYQFFIRASGLTADGRDIPVGKNNGKDAPIQNLTTIDTLAIGVQDNRNFLPTYRKQTVELITPQVTFNSQNHSLLSDKNQNICEAWFPDFRKNASATTRIFRSPLDRRSPMSSRSKTQMSLFLRPSGNVSTKQIGSLPCNRLSLRRPTKMW